MKTQVLPSCLFGAALAVVAGIFPWPLTAYATPIIVPNSVTATQHPATDPHPKYVDISYTISDPDSSSVSIYILVSQDSGATWTVPANTFPVGSGFSVGPNVPVSSVPAVKNLTWDAGADWDGHFTTRCRVRIVANDSGMVLIPFGSYSRGSPLALGDFDITDAPLTSVYISSFLIETNLVTGALWNLVVGWAASQSLGYSFVDPGSYKALTHPVQTINWYDALKWCNARSEREGLTPVYYSDSNFSTVYRAGEFTPVVKPGATGYRLPTEAEWEKAARGGRSVHRFPWSDVDTISESRANYESETVGGYDLGPSGFNVIGTAIGVEAPWTTPVGTFAPNDYGLYDMAGNVSEWCWDAYSSSYYDNGQVDPQGPSGGLFGIQRVSRGGSWANDASLARCAYRGHNPVAQPFWTIGLRCVRTL